MMMCQITILINLLGNILNLVKTPGLEWIFITNHNSIDFVENQMQSINIICIV